MVDEYPSNSKRPRPEEPAKAVEQRQPRLKPIVSTPGEERKKSLGRRFTDTFAGEDAKSVAINVLFEIVVPNLKMTFVDAAKDALDRLVFGETTRGRPTGLNRGSGLVPYNRIMSTSKAQVNVVEAGRRALSPRAAATHDFGEILLATSAEAEDVLEGLSNILDEYGFVKVADLKDLINVEADFADEKWGWTTLRGAGKRRVRDGYILELPPTVANT